MILLYIYFMFSKVWVLIVFVQFQYKNVDLYTISIVFWSSDVLA